jgi:hypothetical protein
MKSMRNPMNFLLLLANTMVLASCASYSQEPPYPHVSPLLTSAGCPKLQGRYELTPVVTVERSASHALLEWIRASGEPHTVLEEWLGRHAGSSRSLAVTIEPITPTRYAIVFSGTSDGEVIGRAAAAIDGRQMSCREGRLYLPQVTHSGSHEVGPWRQRIHTVLGKAEDGALISSRSEDRTALTLWLMPTHGSSTDWGLLKPLPRQPD